MFDVVLHQPEIPPNAGNVIRLCANAGVRLHLVEPLGFRLDDRELKRAGMDYRELAHVTVHPDWDACAATLTARRLYAISTRAQRRYSDERFREGDVFVFGAETRGLPASLLEQFTPERRLRLPMREGNRSINLSNSVAIVVYEAWRQQEFRLGA